MLEMFCEEHKLLGSSFQIIFKSVFYSILDIRLCIQ
jgi:hypothetical protein